MHNDQIAEAALDSGSTPAPTISATDSHSQSHSDGVTRPQEQPEQPQQRVQPADIQGQCQEQPEEVSVKDDSLAEEGAHQERPVLPIRPPNIAQAVASHQEALNAQRIVPQLSTSFPSSSGPSAVGTPSSPSPPASPNISTDPLKPDPTQPTKPTDPYDALARRLEYLISSPDVTHIPEQEVRSIVFLIGVPEGMKIRSLVWKLLLNYLPWDKSKWEEHFAKARREYATFINMLTVNPYAEMEEEWRRREEQRKEEQRRRAREEDGRGFIIDDSGLPEDDPIRAALEPQDAESTTLKTNRLKAGEDPLACGVGSNKWTEFYRDQDIRNEIEKDVKRTYSTLHFFQLPVHPDDRVYHAQLMAAQEETKKKTRAAEQNSKRSIPPHPPSAPSPGSRRTSGLEAGIGPVINLSPDPPKIPSAAPPKPDPSFDLEMDLDAVPSIFGDMTVPGKSKPAQRHLGGDLSLGGDAPVTKSPTSLSSHDAEEASLKGTALQPLDLSTAKRPECHHDVLRRVLFLYAKLNPGVRYVQGMNEILAPIYYVFAHDPDHYSLGKGKSCQQAMKEQNKKHEHANEKACVDSSEEKQSVNDGADPAGPPYDFADPEADAFFCFNNVMSELRDRFIRSLDTSETGAMATVRKLNDRLKVIDFELWKHLESVEVDPRFYSFRWLTLLLSQEFQLPEVIRLWDTFFAEGGQFEFQLTFCCAMLVKLRETLLQSDFADVLKLLQHYPYTDIQDLLNIAHDLKAHGPRSKFVTMRRKTKSEQSEQSATSRIASFFKNFGKK